MPFIVVIAAGYAAYVAYEREKLAKCDESINFEGKSLVTLLPMEEKMGLLELPISCINFYDGDYKKTAPYIELRVNEIVANNPFLGG